MLDRIGAYRAEAVVVGAVVLCVSVTGMWLRSRASDPVIAPPPSIEAAPTAASSPAGVVVVHVAGAVRRPGLYELWDGARVADALEAAGGSLPVADTGALNLAEVLVDGAKIDVPRRGESIAPTAPVASATTPAVVSINTADVLALEMVPGIGPVKAQAIVTFRDRNGPFGAFEDLLEVSGIGPATLDAIRPYITL